MISVDVEISEFYNYVTYFLLLNVNHIDWCVRLKPNRKSNSAKKFCISNSTITCLSFFVIKSHKNGETAKWRKLLAVALFWNLHTRQKLLAVALFKFSTAKSSHLRSSQIDVGDDDVDDKLSATILIILFTNNLILLTDALVSHYSNNVNLRFTIIDNLRSAQLGHRKS